MKCYICRGEVENTVSTVREGKLVHLFVDRCRRVNEALRTELESLKAEQAILDPGHSEARSRIQTK